LIKGCAHGGRLGLSEGDHYRGALRAVRVRVYDELRADGVKEGERVVGLDHDERDL
jgi:hypothetical protein